jgi:hypothetical protein
MDLLVVNIIREQRPNVLPMSTSMGRRLRELYDRTIIFPIAMFQERAEASLDAASVPTLLGCRKAIT